MLNDTRGCCDVVRSLTLFFQVSQSFLNELRGSFELLSKFVSLLTHQTVLHLKVSDAEEQQKQNSRGKKKQRKCGG